MVEHGNTRRKLKPGQLNQRVLGKIFNLFPDSILLVSDDGSVETADDHGNFVDVDDFPIWTCSGDSILSPGDAENSQSQSSSSSYMYQLPSNSSRATAGKKRKWTPTFTSSLLRKNKPPGVQTQESIVHKEPPPPPEKEWRKTIEICRRRGKDWEKVSNLPVTLTEATASVPDIADQVASEAFEAFDGSDVILVDNDYLKILDTPSTRG